MKKLALVLILVNIILLSGASMSDEILKQLADDNSWQVLKTKGATVIRRKSVDGFDLFALEITRKIDVKPEAVFAVLLDVNSYPEILSQSNYLEVEEVSRDPENIIGYQFARIPLVSNRHYLFDFDLKSYQASLTRETMNLHWTLIDPSGKYSEYISKKNQENKNPIYIANGAGLWTIKKLADGRYENTYRLYLDPAGWMPGWLVNSFNVKNLERLFDQVIAAAVKRSN
ncbi:MAG: hypothetical protein P9X26_02950 [Candidatus Stygibacter frigidus]|nr:hypothetical protein [Candidatus Stygibacter frigidus]